MSEIHDCSECAFFAGNNAFCELTSPTKNPKYKEVGIFPLQRLSGSTACDHFKAKTDKIDDLGKEDYSPPKVSAAMLLLGEAKQHDIIELINLISKVDKVKPKVSGDTYTYKFCIQDKVLIIPSDRMMKSTKFSQRYLEEFNILAPVGLTNGGYWALFIRALNELNKIVLIEDERLTTEVYEAENILNAIRKTKTTESKEDFLKHPNLLLVDKDKAFLCADQWKQHIENLKIKTPMDRLLELIKPYYIKTSSKKCVDNKTVWCYIFDRKLVGEKAVSLTNSNPSNRDAEE